MGFVDKKALETTMKIYLKNLGPLKDAEFELGDFTIICGDNNNGKTYATYGLYGFLTYWREAFRLEIEPAKMDELFKVGTTLISINEYTQKADEIISRGCTAYKEQLPVVFSSPEKRFEESSFQVRIDSKHDINPIGRFELTLGAAKSQLFTIKKEANDPNVSITLLVSAQNLKIPKAVVIRTIADALKDILFGHLFPKPFIASAERTGAAIFRKELNFSKRRILAELHKSDDVDPYDLVFNISNDYALPVEANVKFARSLESIFKKTSFITKQHKSLLDEFFDIIGGTYQVTKDDVLHYIQKKGKVKLTLDESSSAVRSLLDIGFYLRHQAEPGDILMIDEPELNLHPSNQRKVARLLAKLVNIGIKVFVTTHSDYIIKEINTLLLLKRDQPHLKAIKEKEKYFDNELLKPEQIRLYMAKEGQRLLDGNQNKTRCQTLIPASINLDEGGIEVSTFDDTIDAMNRIQDEIIWGGEM